MVLKVCFSPLQPFNLSAFTFVFDVKLMMQSDIVAVLKPSVFTLFISPLPPPFSAVLFFITH